MNEWFLVFVVVAGLRTVAEQFPSVEFRLTANQNILLANVTPAQKDAIAAVLNPGDTKDLYFVASGTGGHYFSATIAEQERHVAELRARERIQKTNKIAIPAQPVPHL